MFSPFPSPDIKHQTLGDMKVGSWLWRRVQIILLAFRRTLHFTLQVLNYVDEVVQGIVCMLLPKLKWLYIMGIIFNLPFNTYTAKVLLLMTWNVMVSFVIKKKYI